MAVSSAHSSLIRRASLALPIPYVAPDGELETLVARSFSEVFNIDDVGANDDFFDIGGDSLLAEVFCMVLSERTGYNFEPSSLVEHGSPKQIAVSLRAKSVETFAPMAADDERIRPPIFVVHGPEGFTMPKRAFRQALAKGQKLFMFELPGMRGGCCYGRIEDIAAVYVAQLVEQVPQAPILLAAFCAGGLIALEMAARLAEMGRPVRQLVLLDPSVRRDGSLGIDRMPKKRNSEFSFFIDARTKFHAALLHYRPRPYHGPVTILSSIEREPAFREGSHASNLLPLRRVHVVTEGHNEFGGAASARLLQSICDGALDLSLREPLLPHEPVACT